ncbi:hypothetical protein STIAU_6724, partial [Stigmatella aurantiaca DW4/3-1]
PEEIHCRFWKSSWRLPTAFTSACRFFSKLSVLMTRLRASITSLRISDSSLSTSGFCSDAMDIFLVGPDTTSTGSRILKVPPTDQ